MSMTGDYMSLAEACGEVVHERGWSVGVDFDPSDPEELEVMRLVWEREAEDTETRLRRENENLRLENERLRERLQEGQV